jgi:hypothetical protein
MGKYKTREQKTRQQAKKEKKKEKLHIGLCPGTKEGTF